MSSYSVGADAAYLRKFLMMRARVYCRSRSPEDAAHDAFIAMFKKPDGFENRRHAEGYGVLTLRGLYNDDHDKRRHHEEHATIETHSWHLVAPDNPAVAVDVKQVQEIMQRHLNEMQRKVLWLTGLGYEVAEIAGELNISGANVLSNRIRGRAKLNPFFNECAA